MKKNVIFVILFFTAMGLFSLLTFLLPAKQFSDNENRVLAQSPVLTMDTVLEGQFQSDLADFLSDQIPGRELWIRGNTEIKKLLGKTEINGVYLGENGHYFQKFTEDDYSQKRMTTIFSLIESFASKQTVPVTFLPVPTPAASLRDWIPANAPIYDDDKVWDTLKALAPSCNVLDVRETFANAPQYYYRTDHHWTTQGAYLAYEAYCNARGITPKSLAEFELTAVSDQFYGTIYSKTLDSAAKPDTISATKLLPDLQVKFDGKDVPGIYVEEKLSEKDKYAYFFGGNPGMVEIKTDVQNGKRLLILKDSFANCMVPYLLGEYEEVVMLDLRYFNGKVSQVMADSQITEVLFLYEMTNLLSDTGIAKLG